MGRAAAGIAVVAALAIAGCGHGTSTPPVVAFSPSPPPGNNGAPSPAPTFNPAAVSIAEIPIPQPSPAGNGPADPDVLDVGKDGSVYFGQLNAGFSGFGNFGIFRYNGGTFTQTLPAPQPNAWVGGVNAIDAHDSSTVMWSSSYQQMNEPFSFGDMMQCGANGGTATLCSFAAFDGFTTSIVTAKDGTVWTAGSQCCGAGPGGYPAQLPAPLPANAFALDVTNGPGGNVWGVVNFNGPIYEFTSSGAIMNTYPLPAGNNLVGNHVLVEGRDGALWFTDAGNNAIARLSSTGQISEYKVPTPNSGLQSITLAADGGMWFTESSGNKVGRIDATGKIYEFAIPTANAQPTAIAAVPPGCSCKTSQVWFTETTADKIASVSY